MISSSANSPLNSERRQSFEAGLLAGSLQGVTSIAGSRDPRFTSRQQELLRALHELGALQEDTSLPPLNLLSQRIQAAPGRIDGACFEFGADFRLLQTHLKLASVLGTQSGVPSDTLAAALDSLRPLVMQLRLRVAEIGIPDSIDAFLKLVASALQDSAQWLSSSEALFQESEVLTARLRSHFNPRQDLNANKSATHEGRRELKVFISYASVDEGLAKKIHSQLEQIGVVPFLDKKDIDWGEPILERVAKGLAESSSVVVIVSPASVKSQWVPFEIGLAMALGKKVLPFLVDPTIDVPVFLRGLNHKVEVEEIRAHFSAQLRKEPPPHP